MKIDLIHSLVCQSNEWTMRSDAVLWCNYSFYFFFSFNLSYPNVQKFINDVIWSLLRIRTFLFFCPSFFFRTYSPRLSWMKRACALLSVIFALSFFSIANFNSHYYVCHFYVLAIYLGTSFYVCMCVWPVFIHIDIITNKNYEKRERERE